jgi:hypothetical protein
MRLAWDELPGVKMVMGQPVIANHRHCCSHDRMAMNHFGSHHAAKNINRILMGVRSDPEEEREQTTKCWCACTVEQLASLDLPHKIVDMSIADTAVSVATSL